MRFTQSPETQLRFELVMDIGRLITPANGTVAVILPNTATVVVARQVQFGGTRRLSAESTIALAAGAAWTRQQRQALGVRNSLRQGDRIVRTARFRLNSSWSWVRRAFLSKLDTALRESRDGLAAVMFIDLDGFKAVNDTYGHLSGDNVLVEVAARIRHCVRNSDVVARLAGDEFTVLLAGSVSGKHAITGIAQVILQTLGQPMRIDGRVIQLSASIGVLVPEPSATLSSEVLLRAADDAMYRAKQAGKGRFVMQEISALNAPLAAVSSGR
jgi:diguanylate cyclase (GGDEF)-like protein